jgi:hypothetical protein
MKQLTSKELVTVKGGDGASKEPAYMTIDGVKYEDISVTCGI